MLRLGSDQNGDPPGTPARIPPSPRIPKPSRNGQQVNDRSKLPKRVYFYDCDCEWRSKYCDEEHQRSITLDEIREDAWDEGFNFGHYIAGEKQECDCRENPYRKAGA